MEYWTISRVVPHTTSHPGLTRWEVQAARMCNPFRLQFLTTLKPLVAALCDRAREQHLTVAMSVERTKNGQEIRAVELAGDMKPAMVVKRDGVIGDAEMFERR